MGRRYGRSKIFNKTNWQCKHCESPIEDENDNSIECWKCYNWFHVECTPLDRKQFLEVINKNSSWICAICCAKFSESKSVDACDPSLRDQFNSKVSSRTENSSTMMTVLNSNISEKKSPLNTESKCLHCLVNVSNISHQLIFDENGKKLSLQRLLAECFNIEIKENRNELQALCQECVHKLIETNDLMQIETNNFKETTPKPSFSNMLTSVKLEILSSECEDNIDDEEHGFNQDDNHCDDGNDNGNDHNFSEDNDNLIENVKNDTSENILVEEFHISEVKEQESDNKLESYTESVQLNQDEDNEFENIDYLEDYDDIAFDFRAYKEKVIKNHKFNEISFPEPIECVICSAKLGNHIEIIEHIKESHCSKNCDTIVSYSCAVDNLCTPLITIEDLSFHLVFKHYDLEKLIILSECPECKKFFENFLSYNKHSCDKTKRYTRAQVECEQCGKIFKSNKRYRFHLQFHLEKRRPKACLICDKMFRDEDEFYDHVKYDHEKNIGNVCRSCDVKFSTEENLKTHFAISHNDDSVYYNCSKCMRKFASKQHLRQHMYIHGQIKYECNICGKLLSRKSRLTKHLVRHKHPVEKEVITCSECGFVARDDNDAEEHLSKHSNISSSVDIETLSIAYACEHCDLAFNTVDNLFIHRENHPLDEFVCGICNVKRNKYSAISSHKLSHAKYLQSLKEFPIMKHYVCRIAECQKSYPLWTSLNLHKMKNHGSRESHFNCVKCNLNFPTLFQYKNHLTNNHEGKLIFDCSFCNKSFRIRAALTLHIKKIHKKPITEINNEMKRKKVKKEVMIKEEKLIKTENIEKKRKLKKKEKKEPKPKVQKFVIPKPKKFNCQVCGKAFSTRNDTSFHEKAVHEKEARFFCPHCSFKTPYKQTLTYHLQTHSNVYPYECTICSRKFRFKNSYKLHEQRHQNVRNYICNIDGCCLSYINLGRLRTHQKLKHSPKIKNLKIKKEFNHESYTDTFIDDDDGLDDSLIGAQNQQQHRSFSGLSSYQSQPTKIYKSENLIMENSDIIIENIPIINSDNQENNNIRIIHNEDMMEENVDDPNEYYTIEEGEDIVQQQHHGIIQCHNQTMNNIKPVLIIRNNEYIMQLDHTKIYGNALEVSNIQDTEVAATEIVASE